MQRNKRFEVLGINDDRDFCECCGKLNLKRVVWIKDNETGIVRHFGVVCADKPAKGFDVSAEIKQASKEFKAKQDTKQREAMYADMSRRYEVAKTLYFQRGGTMETRVAKYNGKTFEAYSDQSLFSACHKEAFFKN